MNTKITLATFKKFIVNNTPKGNENPKLWIKVKSRFDGQIDGINYDANAEFNPIQETIMSIANTLRIQGVWLVLGSRDYFTSFENETFKGIEVSNSCGSFILAIRK